MSILTHPRTYVYTREDGVRCHQQMCGPWSGDEYEHPDDPNWLPGADWPYAWRLSPDGEWHEPAA